MNPSRVRLDAFIARAGASLPPGARVLDAGAGDCRYRVHFRHTRYESADFLQVDKHYGPVDYVCDLADLPMEDERYDLVLFTQVLEHLPRPADVLWELRRVLRRRAALWLTAPLFYREHEQPYDFFRYTQFGLRHLLAETGFEVRELGWLEGYFGTLSYQLSEARRSLPVRSRHYGGGVRGAVAASLARLSRPALSASAQALARLELRAKYEAAGLCKNYAAVAVRAR
jgi:SAM-dependent methyltransferase